MYARMRYRTRVKGLGLLALAAIVITGCSCTRSNRGGCGGGCCQASQPEPARVAAPAAIPPGQAATLPGQAVAAAAKPYGGQTTCPVMGEKLGSMGPAIPVTVKGDTVYVCCRGCAGKVQRDPDKYLAQVQAERAASQ